MTNTCTDTSGCQDTTREQDCCSSRTASDCCEENKAEKLLHLADEAFKELLKEKIKQELEKSSGAKLAGLAKTLAEANLRRHGHAILGKKACKEFEGQLQSLLMEIVT